MAWLEILHNTGASGYTYNFYVNYTLSDNAYGNYTDVTVNGVRFEQTSSGYIYNNYPSRTDLWGWEYCATLGVGVDGTKPTPQRVTLGNVKGTKDYRLNSVTVRVYHDEDGNGSCNIQGYSQTQCYGYAGTFGWVSKKISLKKFDRSPASIKVNKKSVSDTSSTFEVSTTDNIEKVEYKIDSGEWISLGALNENTETYTISDLSKNTSYNIHWRCKKSSNGVYSSPFSIKIRTDAPAASNVKISNLSSTQNSINFTITANEDPSNKIEYYSYKISNSWSQWTTSNEISINSLEINSFYNIYARVKTNNGKITETADSISAKTKGESPSILGLQLISNKTKSLEVKAINYKAQAGIKNFTFTLQNGAQAITKTIDKDQVLFSDLTPGTKYTITCVILDEDGQKASYTDSFKTKNQVESNFDLIINNITNNSFIISLPKMEIDLKQVNYYINDNKYPSLNTEKTFTSLEPYKEYTIQVEIINNEDIHGISKIKKIRTLPLPPDFKIDILKIRPREMIFNINLIKEPGVNLKESKYSIDGSLPNIVINNYPCTIQGLKPNKEYPLSVLVTDKDGQSVKKVLVFKTLEDKWVYLSINGQPFYKCNVFIIDNNGIKKIEKSKRHIL